MASRVKHSQLDLILSTWHRALISLAFLIVASYPLYSVSAAPRSNSIPLPDLLSFTLSVQNGDGSVVRGAYADGLFALPVVQQPGFYAGFVSTAQDTLTQFGMASQLGNVGLLAHDDLSGQYFSQLLPGMRLQLIYGNGRVEYYTVSRVYRYQATSPYSVTSDFIDLDTHEYLTAADLFAKVYRGPRHVTFQTCINRVGNPSWGRLFVIAEPEHFSFLPIKIY